MIFSLQMSNALISMSQMSLLLEKFLKIINYFTILNDKNGIIPLILL